MTIKANLKALQEKIVTTAQKVGRNQKDIKLITVTKTVDAARIAEVLSQGVTAIGENRVQEAKEKYGQLPSGLEWHLIGSLQTNKVKDAVQLFDYIHSVDRKHLAEEINRQCLSMGKKINVLVQVNISGEISKHGVSMPEAEDLILYVASLPALHLRGLMTIAPFVEDEKIIRASFQGLKNLAEKMNREKGLHLEELSMGMTDDFMIAIEEGATMIRIGSAIFGARNQ